MANYGVTQNGFVRPRLVDIQGEVFSSMESTFGQNLNELPQSLVSQYVGIQAEREDLIWQAMEDVYNSEYPDLAFGVSLDNAASLTGAVRRGALPSNYPSELLFGTVGTLIPAGSQISVKDSPTSIFETVQDVTLVAGQNCIQTLTPSAVPTAGAWQLALGANLTTVLAFNANAAAIQAALNALPFGAGITVVGDYTGFTVTFAGAAGLQTQAALTVQNNTLATMAGAVTVAVTITQAGMNQGLVAVTAVATGPTIAPAGSLTVIVTPINGWDSAINKLDATVGRNVETDNEFKQRRRTELQVAGEATTGAIEAKLSDVSGVQTVLVFENDTTITDMAGRPAKSFEAVVEGGADQDIWNAIFAVKAAGIQAYGTDCGTVTDSKGQVHTVCFSRPTGVNIYIKLLLTINSDFPATGVATCQQELAAFGNALGIGKEVVTIPYLISAIANVPGIEDATLLIGTAPNPVTSDNVAIGPEEVAVFDTSRITVITS